MDLNASAVPSCHRKKKFRTRSSKKRGQVFARKKNDEVGYLSEKNKKSFIKNFSGNISDSSGKAVQKFPSTTILIKTFRIAIYWQCDTKYQALKFSRKKVH